MTAPIRIATRTSQLALWQANHIAERLCKVSSGRHVELIHITTTGDRDQTGSLRQFGGMGVFTREVQAAVLDHRADLAVHSLKDLPTQTVPGLRLAAVPERSSVFDALLLPRSSNTIAGLQELRAGATVATGSPRRQAQLLHARPDLQLFDVRGNVDTRIRKLDDGEFDALILAEAGLLRLGLADRIALRLSPPVMLPAVGQGALGLECRADDNATHDVLRMIDDGPTHRAVQAERSLLHDLRAGCHAPVGVETRIDDSVLTLKGVVLSLDGRTRIAGTASGVVTDPERVGRELANELRQHGAVQLLDGDIPNTETPPESTTATPQ